MGGLRPPPGRRARDDQGAVRGRAHGDDGPVSDGRRAGRHGAERHEAERRQPLRLRDGRRNPPLLDVGGPPKAPPPPPRGAPPPPPNPPRRVAPAQTPGPPRGGAPANPGAFFFPFFASAGPPPR